MNKTYAGIGNRKISGAKDGDHGLPVAKVTKAVPRKVGETSYAIEPASRRGIPIINIKTRAGKKNCKTS